MTTTLPERWIICWKMIEVKLVLRPPLGFIPVKASLDSNAAMRWDCRVDLNEDQADASHAHAKP